MGGESVVGGRHAARAGTWAPTLLFLGLLLVLDVLAFTQTYLPYYLQRPIA